MNEFSLYYSDKGIKQVIPTKVINLKECANIILTDENLIRKTTDLRDIPDKKERAKYKACLPYVTFSGTFSSRANNKLLERSEYFCCDLDNIGENGQIKETGRLICQYFLPALMFVSPSGNGLKVIFQIDNAAGSHQDYFSAFNHFFKTKLNKEIDKQCSDISRASFLCNDPEVFFTETPDILSQDFLLASITIEIAEIPVMDEASSFDAAKKWTDSKLTFAPGYRNKYIYVLTDCCNRYGISERFVSTKLQEFAESDFTVDEIETIIKSRYSHVEWFGIAKNAGAAITIPDGKNPYMRVGTTYYKVIEKTDRYNIKRKELKVWNKDSIIQDHKKSFLKTIPRYDDFVMIPDNLNYKPSVNNCYNLYSEFCHIPEQGEFIWTQRLLKHVFGEQYLLGLRYMQILYLHPDHSTIILVLVSKERGTGKTTFLNWINIMFGANVALISSTDFLSGFNSHYAQKNIIAIEETLFDKKLTIEKLKALTTAKYIQINEKFVTPYKIPFYGKVILTSNNEEKFAQIDDEEIRFLVRKLSTPEFTNHNIEANLLQEIPAFLHYLKSLPQVDWTISRSGFTGRELVNEALYAVVKESKSTLCKELRYSITDFFFNCELESFLATPGDLKQKYFAYNNNYGAEYIRSVLKNEFNMDAEKLQRYEPFNDITTTKIGRPYLFYRNDFINDL